MVNINLIPCKTKFLVLGLAILLIIFVVVQKIITIEYFSNSSQIILDNPKTKILISNVLNRQHLFSTFSLWANDAQYAMYDDTCNGVKVLRRYIFLPDSGYTVFQEIRDCKDTKSAQDRYQLELKTLAGTPDEGNIVELNQFIQKTDLKFADDAEGWCYRISPDHPDLDGRHVMRDATYCTLAMRHKNILFNVYVRYPQSTFFAITDQDLFRIATTNWDKTLDSAQGFNFLK